MLVPYIVDEYKCFLKTENPKRLKSYSDLLKHQPASARAEAVTFHFLRVNTDSVQVEEDRLKEGGVDFRCKAGNGEFIAEVTCLGTESVADKSGLEKEPPLGVSVRNYKSITPKLFNTVCSKESQMSEYKCPGILVIACEHPLGDGLLDHASAQSLLRGDSEIQFSIDPSGQNANQGINQVTEFKKFCLFAI